MMKKGIKLMFIFLLLGMGMNICAQESLMENPRGVYKLMNTVGTDGKITAVSNDQYIICTDSTAWLLDVRYKAFELYRIGGNAVFNYTGEEPDSANPLARRIYNSNARQFTLKWWNGGERKKENVPSNNWCIENYESNQFSEVGREITDALVASEKGHVPNSFIGRWKTLGKVASLNNKEVERIRASSILIPYEETEYNIVAPSSLLRIKALKGRFSSISMDDDAPIKKFLWGGKVHKVAWLSPDTVAVQQKDGYVIWARMPEEMSFIDRIWEQEKVLSQKDLYADAYQWMLSSTPEGGFLLLAAVRVLDEDKYAKLCWSQKVRRHYVPRDLTRSLASEYKKQFLNDVMEAFYLYSHDSLPIESLHRLKEMYDTQQAKTATQNMFHLQDTLMHVVIPQMLIDVSLSGNIPSPVSRVVCTESYQEAFLKYYRSANMEQMMMDEYWKIVTEKLEKKDRNILPELSKYMSDNLYVLALNTSIGIMTEEDLLHLNGILATPEGRTFVKTTGDFTRKLSQMFGSEADNEVTAFMKMKFFSFVDKNIILVRKVRTILVHEVR